MIIPINNRPVSLYEHPMVHKLIAERLNKNSVVVDIGCELPLLLFELQMKYRLECLIGIDKLENEQNLINRWAEHDGSRVSESYNSIRKCHEDYLKQFGESFNLTSQKIEYFIVNYDKHYKLILDYDITKRDLHVVNNSNLVICLGVLHFMDFKTTKEVVQKISRSIKSDGILILDANSDENQSMTNLQYVEKMGERHYRSIEYNEEVWLFDDLNLRK